MDTPPYPSLPPREPPMRPASWWWQHMTDAQRDKYLFDLAAWLSAVAHDEMPVFHQMRLWYHYRHITNDIDAAWKIH